MESKTPAFFRIASLAAGAVYIFIALASNPQGIALKIGAALGAAILTWITTILTETYKHKATILANHYGWINESIKKVDLCLYELRKINKSVNGGLAMRWQGQSLEDWDANAMAAINKITIAMDDMGKELWQQRAFIECSDQLESDLNELSFSLKRMMQCHVDWQHKYADPSTSTSWRESSEKVKSLLPDLDQRLRAARREILSQSLSV